MFTSSQLEAIKTGNIEILGSSVLFFLIVPTLVSFLFRGSCPSLCNVKKLLLVMSCPLSPGELSSRDFYPVVLHQVSQCRLLSLKVHRT